MIVFFHPSDASLTWTRSDGQGGEGGLVGAGVGRRHRRRRRRRRRRRHGHLHEPEQARRQAESMAAQNVLATAQVLVAHRYLPHVVCARPKCQGSTWLSATPGRREFQSSSPSATQRSSTKTDWAGSFRVQPVIYVSIIRLVWLKTKDSRKIQYKLLKMKHNPLNRPTKLEMRILSHQSLLPWLVLCNAQSPLDLAIIVLWLNALKKA